MVKTDFTKVQDNHSRETLRDQDQKGGPLARYEIGVAIAILAVLGVGAALGIAQLVGGDGAATTEWTLEEELAAIRRNGTASQLKAPEWALEDELAAIRRNGTASQPKAPEWTLEDELAAIKSGSKVHQPEPSSEPITQVSGPR